VAAELIRGHDKGELGVGKSKSKPKSIYIVKIVDYEYQKVEANSEKEALEEASFTDALLWRHIHKKIVDKIDRGD